MESRHCLILTRFLTGHATSTFQCHRHAWQVPGSVVTLAATPRDSPTAPKPGSAFASHRGSLHRALPECPHAQLQGPASGSQEGRDAEAVGHTPGCWGHRDSRSPLSTQSGAWRSWHYPTTATSSPLRQGSAIHPARSDMLQTQDGCPRLSQVQLW